MANLFSRTKLLESKIDQYLDHTSEAGLLFHEALKDYLGDRVEEFEERRKKVSELENHADSLRREVEHQLYIETLIPESRGDVLGLLEQTDEVISDIKTVLMQISVERPVVPEQICPGWLELVDYAGRAVQELVMGVRAFFRNPSGVADYVHKVAFWEKEADKVAERLKRNIFKLDVELSYKMQLSSFVTRVDSVTDQAEDVSERLSISTIKRTI
jgi:predicted phosphate transport protein (TIGR00153 family)